MTDELDCPTCGAPVTLRWTGSTAKQGRFKCTQTGCTRTFGTKRGRTRHSNRCKNRVTA